MKLIESIVIVSFFVFAGYVLCVGAEPSNSSSLVIPFKELSIGQSTTLTYDVTTYFKGNEPEGFNTDKPLNAQGVLEVICGKQKVLLSQPVGQYESKAVVLVTFKECKVLNAEKASEGKDPKAEALKLLKACKQKEVVICIRERAAPPGERNLELVVTMSGNSIPSGKEK